MLYRMKRLPHLAAQIASAPMTRSANGHTSGPLFGDFKYQLAQVLARRGMGVTEYGKRIGHANGGLVHKVLSGEKVLPLENISAWLDALELSDEEYGAMYLEALKNYAPRYIIDIINAMDSVVRDFERLWRATAVPGEVVPAAPTLTQVLGQRLARRDVRHLPDHTTD